MHFSVQSAFILLGKHAQECETNANVTGMVQPPRSGPVRSDGPVGTQSVLPGAILRGTVALVNISHRPSSRIKTGTSVLMWREAATTSPVFPPPPLLC